MSASPLPPPPGHYSPLPSRSSLPVKQHLHCFLAFADCLPPQRQKSYSAEWRYNLVTERFSSDRPVGSFMDFLKLIVTTVMSDMCSVWYQTGSQPADIFGGEWPNDCSLLLCLTTKHFLKISGSGLMSDGGVRRATDVVTSSRVAIFQPAAHPMLDSVVNPEASPPESPISSWPPEMPSWRSASLEKAGLWPSDVRSSFFS